uniref:DDE Tnp4 domain-containing protein n=1 Tax=Salarias fasciatus TaxID=181472 RepID=A0A672GMW1_SALFA
MTERTRSRIQAAEMSFLRRVAGRSLRDKVRSSVTREELGVEPLLLHIERNQLRWLGHLFRMPPGRLPREVFRACPTGRRPRGRPRTRWRDYVSRLAWERLGILPEELEEVSGDREVWASLLRLLPPQCSAPSELHRTLLRSDHLCLVYTGLPLDTFNFLADELIKDHILMTLMTLRQNPVQEDLAERFVVSQSGVSRIISAWLDIMEEKLSSYIVWLPRETIDATTLQCFKEHHPTTTCLIDCFETALPKPHNLDSRGASYSHCYGQNTIKYLVAIAPCGLIMFISAAYGGRRSDKFITSDCGFLDCLRPGDVVMADRGFVISDLLHERRVNLVIPAFTKKGRQLSEEDTTHTRRIANVRVHVERVIRRLKNYKIVSQTVPINLAHKMDKILSVCSSVQSTRRNYPRKLKR